MTELERHIRKWMEMAIMDFDMIAPGDRIAVAVSGGADSILLSLLLDGSLIHVTSDYTVFPVHIDGAFPGSDTPALIEWTHKAGIDLSIIESPIHKSAFGQKKSPCFICSRMRKKAILEFADANNCNKVAMGHHRDDAVESLLLSMTWNREISTTIPVQPLFKGRFTIIRPFYYIRGKILKTLAAESAIPDLQPPCPMSTRSKRIAVRNLLESLELENPNAVDSLFSSMFRIRSEYMPTYSSPSGATAPPIPPRLRIRHKQSSSAPPSTATLHP